MLPYVRDRQGGFGTGGMASKLNAARIATTAGENVIIASGRQPGVLQRIVHGEQVGTLFLAQGQVDQPAETLDRLLRPALRPASPWTPGLARRSFSKGAACWPSAYRGRRRASSAKAIWSRSATSRASRWRGACRTTTPTTCSRIRGLHSDRIAQVLGHRPYEEVIHRDNMVVF